MSLDRFIENIWGAICVSYWEKSPIPNPPEIFIPLIIFIHSIKDPISFKLCKLVWIIACLCVNFMFVLHGSHVFTVAWIKNSYGFDNNIQLSPEGEVHSGGYNYTKTRSVKVYIHHSSPTLRRIVVLVFTKSDGKKYASTDLVNTNNNYY